MRVIFERRQGKTVYREFDPMPGLSDHVQCFWTMATSDLKTIHRVIPDGGMNLLFEWTNRGFRCRLVGCLTGPLMNRYRLPTDVLAVRFRPAGASDFFPKPADLFSGNVLDAFTFWEHAEKLASILNRARTSDQSLQSVNEFLAHFLARQVSRPEQQKATLGKQVVSRIATEPADFDMRELSADFGRSRQQITRAVKSVCGLSPKRLARILRLQCFIEKASTRPKNWAALAVESGYYDQAHLIHDFNEFTGTPPANFIHERFPETSIH